MQMYIKDNLTESYSKLFCIIGFVAVIFAVYSAFSEPHYFSNFSTTHTTSIVILCNIVMIVGFLITLNYLTTGSIMVISGFLGRIATTKSLSIEWFYYLLLLTAFYFGYLAFKKSSEEAIEDDGRFDKLPIDDETIDLTPYEVLEVEEPLPTQPIEPKPKTKTIS